MEELKRLEDIMLPDTRQESFAVIDRDSGDFRSRSLQDIYDNAASIVLHDGVPEVIRTHFATALNLLIYSWFFYPFNVTAEFLAYVTVEFALKERLNPQKPMLFKQLVRLAVERGLVKDEGFSHVRGRLGLPDPFESTVDTLNQPSTKYAGILSETLPYLRNTLAHGSSMLHGTGASAVRICADFINQLFPLPNS